MRSLALCVLGILPMAACAPDATPDAARGLTMPSPAAPLDTTALTRHGLAASSLPELQLLATPFGRGVLAQVVSCALPRGASLTTINRDGTPFSFAGEHGLAPAWAHRPATAHEHAQVTRCLRDHGLFPVQA
ncbi:MAG TPA: hypothetical protein VFP84_14540 [Kofleriaceae bacterium]|nr:hypothetical protein [Kofleriaceae bacterium]